MIDGRYKIVRQLGAGSMGVVHLAQDVFLDRSVAIKLIDPVHASDPLTTERFKKEAQALAKIKHANVVQIYAFGPHERSFYFAMEYVAGRSLESAIDAGETVDVGHGIDVLRPIADGLAAVHDLKLVHRDIKPSNIVIENDTNRPVLIDFGLARRRSASNPRFSIAAGTPMYMAPEQAADPDGTRVTFRADIYGLACTAYELFTGHAVFEGKDIFEILTGHMKKPPPPLSSHRPDLRAFDAVFNRALAKAPTDRHESAPAFVAELAEALKKSTQARRNDTLAPGSMQRGSFSIGERVIVLARDEGIVKQMRRVVTRVIATTSRSAVVEHVASASELIESFTREPAAIVLIDDEGAELNTVDLVHGIREQLGGGAASILVVSRDWQKLRVALKGAAVRDVLPKPLVVQMLTQSLERIVATRSPPARSGT